MTWYIYGLILINTESHEIIDETGTEGDQYEYYSEIKFYGRTDPILKVPSNKVSYGWKQLTAIYSDDFKQIYASTFKRTLLYYGRKVWINCPTIFHIKNDKTLTFKADLFANNRRVPAGYGKFKYHGKTTSPWKLNVVNGHVEEEHPEIRPKNEYDYSFVYENNPDYKLTESVGHGIIYLYSVPKGKIPLIVDVSTIILNHNQNGKLVARVYKRDYQTIINREDTPGGGYVTFYIDGKKVWYNKQTQWKLNSSGFASVPFKALASQWSLGTHNIVATYTPDTPELQKKYIETSGGGTLFIGNDKNFPAFQSDSAWCTFIGNFSKTISIYSNKELDGYVQLYIDEQLVKLKHTSSPNYKLKVNVAPYNTFDLSFSTTSSLQEDNWLFTGYHNIKIVYSHKDSEEEVPIEYIHYFNDFYIQCPINLSIEGEPDINPYVDNLFYINSNGNVGFFNAENISPKSMCIGHIMRIKVENKQDKNDIVNKGCVKVTLVSRTEKTNIQETTNIE